MSQKQPKGITFYFKLLLGLVCALLGLKIFLAVAGAVTLGVTLFSILMWGAGALLVGGGLLFGVLKLTKKK